MTLRSIAVCVALLLPALAAEAQQVKLRLTSQLPGSHHIGKGLLPADQLVEKVPAIAILQQPFVFNFSALVKAAADPDKEMRPLIDQAILQATGSRVLLWAPFGSTVMLSRQRPTLHPSDIANQKVRVLGKTHGAFIQQCGGVSAIIPAGDQIAAMQDGRADMLMTGVTGVPARHLWKVTDTITRTEHATLEMLVIVKESVWQSLTDRHRAILGEVAQKVDRKLHDDIAEIEETDYRFSREKGMTIHALTPDQVVEWRACSAPVIEDFMTNAGVLGNRLMDAYGKLRLDPCCSAGPEGAFTRR